MYRHAVVLLFMLMKMDHWSNHGRQPLRFRDIEALLPNQTCTLEEINYTELLLEERLGGRLFARTYLDCLELVFADNCLWHRSFKLLIGIGKSILAK